MTQHIISFFITALGFFIGAQILSGVKIKNYVTALIIVLVVAVLNFFLGSFLKIVTLGILGFGIFTLILDAIIILVANWFLDDFEVKSFWSALALAFIVALTKIVAGMIF